MDPLLNIIAVTIFGFNALELGLFNSLWTIAYIPVSRIVNKLVNKGYFRRALSYSTITLTLLIVLSIISLTHRVKQILYTIYMLHAVTYALSRTSIYTSLLEYYDSSRWSIATYRFMLTVFFIESLLLITISFIGYSVFIDYMHLFLIIVLLVSFKSVFSIPQPELLIERIIFSIEKRLGNILYSTKTILTPLNPYTSREFDRDLLRYKAISLTTIYLSITSLRVSNEYVFTPLPLILRGIGFNAESVILVYGLSKLACFIILLITPVNSLGLTYLSILSRLAVIAYFSISFNTSIATIVLLLTLTYLSHVFTDTALYSLFNEVTYGYKTGTYMAIAEIASLTGSLSSGVILSSFGFGTLFSINVLLLIMLLILVVKVRV